MNANFFNQIAQLNITGVLQLNISKGADDTLVVSTILNNEECGDKAKNAIIPYNLNGTPDELDEGYFTRITQPMQAASGLMHNTEAFMKQLETAKQKSAMEKEKTDKEKKARDEKKKKYDEAMKKVDELERAGKYREAWVNVPDTALFPEQTETIQKRRASLSAKFTTPDLFSASETAITMEPQAEKQEDAYNDNPDDDGLSDNDDDNWDDDNEAE